MFHLRLFPFILTNEKSVYLAVFLCESVSSIQDENQSACLLNTDLSFTWVTL